MQDSLTNHKKFYGNSHLKKSAKSMRSASDFKEFISQPSQRLMNDVESPMLDQRIKKFTPQPENRVQNYD